MTFNKEDWLLALVTALVALQVWIVTQVHSIDKRAYGQSVQLSNVERRIQELQNIIKWSGAYPYAKGENQ